MGSLLLCYKRKLMDLPQNWFLLLWRLMTMEIEGSLKVLLILLKNLERAVATHSSTLAWRISWTGEPGGYSPWGPQELDTTEWLHFHLLKKFHLYFSNFSEDWGWYGQRCFLVSYWCLTNESSWHELVT